MHGQEKINVHNRQTISAKDSIYLTSLYEKINKFIYTHKDSAEELNKLALQLSTKYNYREGKINAYVNFANLFQQQDKRKAINYITKAIQVTKPTGNNIRLVRQFVFLTALLESVDDYTAILKLYNSILPLFESDQREINQMAPKLFNNIGRSYFQTGRYDSSLFYYEKALSQLYQTNTFNYRDAVLANSALGMINTRIMMQDKAISYFEKAYRIAILFSDTQLQISQLTNLGTLYYEMKNYGEAERKLYQALEMSERTYYEANTRIYVMLALVTYFQNPDSIKSAIRFAELSHHQAKSPDGIIQTAYVLGGLYQKDKQYQKGERYLLKGLSLARERGIRENISTAYSALSELYAGLGNFKKAYEYQGSYYQIKDSLGGADNAERITHVEQQYKTAALGKQLAEQEGKIRGQQFLITTVSITGISLAMLMLVLYRNNKAKQQLSLAALKKEKEIDLLKMRMETEQKERDRIGRELHDGIVSQLLAVRLNLNAFKSKDGHQINEYALTHISKQLEDATQDLRSTAHSLMPDALLQQGLINAVSILRNKVVRAGKLEVDFQVLSNMPVFNAVATLSIYRIVQELIQNTLKHADATQLLVQFSFRHAIFYITVEDNGKGFDKNTDNPAGIGLKSVESRVRELYGTLDISTSPGIGTIVYLEFEEQWIT